MLQYIKNIRIASNTAWDAEFLFMFRIIAFTKYAIQIPVSNYDNYFCGQRHAAELKDCRIKYILGRKIKPLQAAQLVQYRVITKAFQLSTVYFPD